MQNSCSEQLFGKLTGRSASIHKKSSTIDICGELSKNFWGAIFFNTQIDGCFWKRTVLLEKLLWYDKSMKTFKTWVTHERVEGRLTKKVAKNDVGGGVAAKKKWYHSLKKNEILRVTCFLNDPYDADLFCCFLWVYLLMILLAFYETNKPYISK